MKQLRILGIFTFLIVCYFHTNAQIGNYIRRDSTLTSSYLNYNFILGPKTANNLENFVGYYSLRNTMIGSYSAFNLSREAVDNTIIGAFAGYKIGNVNSNGYTSENTFVGSLSGYSVEVGYQNTFIGSKAAFEANNISGSVIIGNAAGKKSKTTDGNVFIGNNAGYNVAENVNFNTFVGYNAGSGNDNLQLKGKENVYIGAFAGQNSNTINTYVFTAGRNTFVGTNAGRVNTWDDNTFIGHNSGSNNGNGTQNTFLGKDSGLLNTTGFKNTFLGVEAGRNNQNATSNTFIGFDAGVSVEDAPYVSNSVAIGAEARVTASNSIILGQATNQFIKVGIGNTAPQNKLEITSATTNTSGLRFTNLKSTSTPSTANSLGLSVDANGDVILVPAGGGGADVWDQLTNGADYLIRNKNNKSVMVGTVAAAKTSVDYKLYVEKGILAEKVKVSVQANWPDYVFGKNYSLMPLKEVENYITTNNHLPEVPSAEVIAKDGLDLGKMDATLLKKVEELTLYLIEQSKQISYLIEQNNKIEMLQNELNTLKAKK